MIINELFVTLLLSPMLFHWLPDQCTWKLRQCIWITCVVMMRQFFTIFPKVDFFTGSWMRTIIVLTFSPSGENVNTNMALIHRQVKGETYHSTLRMIWDHMIIWQMILKCIIPLRSIITNNDRRELCYPSPCGER